MSHGECQKLLLASLLALSPEVLLLDEPTAFLDPLERKRFYEILEILKKEHLVILIDHHVKEIISKIDILITVDEMGEIVLQKDIILPESAILPTYIMPQITKGSAFDIHIDNLHFSYEKYFELINIKNEVIRSGEIVIIKGKNGTGKSTLLKLISGLLVAPKNSIIIKRDGNAITPKQFYKEVAYIFQDPESSFLFDTLKEELGGESFWFTAKELERSPYLFSEGEKRRISIFSALSQNKNILLYDEPTFGQDQKNIKMLTDIILNLKKMNKLQIIISHDEDFIEKVGDRILSLKDIDSNE
jgi:energy-coupling factor transport system ATP-binding protein